MKIAEKKVEQMAEELGIDLDEDEAAKAALEYAVSVVETKKEAVASKLAAARLILDFTKKKPASSTEVKLNAAEEFLAALADKDDK